MLSTKGHVFNSDSTFPSETYSPNCSFTKSFFLSNSQSSRTHWLGSEREDERLLTNDLDGSVWMDFADITGSEPLLAILKEKVFLGFVGQLVIPGRYVVSADNNFPSWIRNVRDFITGFLPVFQIYVADGRGGAYPPRTPVVSLSRKQEKIRARGKLSNILIRYTFLSFFFYFVLVIPPTPPTPPPRPAPDNR
jgi:hypothetical protein